MPWQEESTMQLRRQFIQDVQSGATPFTELCRAYGISRKTGYKCLDRYEAGGLPGLADRSRRPQHSPRATPPELVRALLEARHHHPTWGPRKLLRLLRQELPDAPWPARSTIALHLHRAGLVVTPRRVRRPGHPGRPQAPMDAPNAIWTVDFKGQFKLGDGQYCYPLTVADGYSRLLLRCQALTSTQGVESRPVFQRAFEEYGLPTRIRSDNGVPFATQALGRLSPLSVWWMRLGILPDLTEPASPQQNGRHERMHRTLKAECTRPPRATRRAQQRRFDTWRTEYNELRPHEALHDATPAFLLYPLTAAVSAPAPAARVPGALRSPPGQPQRGHPLVLRVGECQSDARRRTHRPGRDRPPRVGRVLRTAPPRPVPRGHAPDRGCLGPPAPPPLLRGVTYVLGLFCYPCP